MKIPKLKSEGVSYWESMADSMISLLLCILLIAMLLILYLVRIPDDELLDWFRGDTYEDYDSWDGAGDEGLDDDEGDEEYPYQEIVDDAGGGDDGGDGDGEYDEEPNPEGDYAWGETLSKAAVYVQVVDGETGRTIKESDIRFELYGADSTLQVLKTYYPNVIEYKRFETDSQGVFYLPEKIPYGTYTLKNLTPVTGYETAEDVEFTIDYPEDYAYGDDLGSSGVQNYMGWYYDWSNPYVVTVSFYPGKNILSLHLVDDSDGTGLPGVTFEIIAAENIITKDGTVRYNEGQVVQALTLDENGAAESEELYLGKYRLHQVSVPNYYARLTEDTVVDVQSKKVASSGKATTLTAEKTTATVTVVDSAHRTQEISGAAFVLMTENGRTLTSATSDEHGDVVFTDLQKNTTYRIKQTASVDNYRFEDAEVTFAVDADGYIDGIAKAGYELTNYVIRISVGVTDRIFGGQVSDVNFALLDANGSIVETWNSSGAEKVISGIEPGDYRVVINGDEEKAYSIHVEETDSLQNYNYARWTNMDIGVIAGGSVLGIAILAILILLLRRRHR